MIKIIEWIKNIFCWYLSPSFIYDTDDKQLRCCKCRVKDRLTKTKIEFIKHHKCKILNPTDHYVGDICHFGHKITKDCSDFENDSCEDYCYSGGMG